MVSRVWVEVLMFTFRLGELIAFRCLKGIFSVFQSQFGYATSRLQILLLLKVGNRSWI